LTGTIILERGIQEMQGDVTRSRARAAGRDTHHTASGLLVWTPPHPSMTMSDLPLWFVRASSLGMGLAWGSFLNVVIYRVPRGMSVVRPGSHCPGCGKPIAAYDNIPVLSYLVLRGRARCCKAKLSPRYPLVEAIGGALALALVELVWRAMPPETPLGRAAAIMGADFALCLGLVAAAFIDAEHMFLPDSISLGGAVLGLATAPMRGVGWKESLVGAAIGFFSVRLVLGGLYRVLRGREGMGIGDAKLTMLAGAWFGWPAAFFALLAASVQGTIYAIAVYLVKGKIEEPDAVKADREELRKAAAEGDEEAKELLGQVEARSAPATLGGWVLRFFEWTFLGDRVDPLADEPEPGELGQARLPFGPFIILGILEWLFFGDRIAAMYGWLITPPG
jgi:leader peptidase (prepilin peptidase)/N-methyltransferase